jgi:hypothetical protein
MFHGDVRPCRSMPCSGLEPRWPENVLRSGMVPQDRGIIRPRRPAMEQFAPLLQNQVGCCSNQICLRSRISRDAENCAENPAGPAIACIDAAIALAEFLSHYPIKQRRRAHPKDSWCCAVSDRSRRALGSLAKQVAVSRADWVSDSTPRQQHWSHPLNGSGRSNLFLSSVGHCWSGDHLKQDL